MKILLAGILGAIAMFIWTAIAHMALPLGEAGIGEIPNESAVLSTMQSSIGDQTGLYIFPGMGVGKNASRQEKSEAMKHMDEKIAANPSGILMYHAPGRPFTFGKALGIEFATAITRSDPRGVSARTDAHRKFRWPSRLRFRNRDPGRDCHQRFLLELVRLPRRLYRQLYADPDRRLFRCGNRRRAGFAQAGFRCLTLKTVRTFQVPKLAP